MIKFKPINWDKEKAYNGSPHTISFQGTRGTKGLESEDCPFTKALIALRLVRNYINV